MSRPFDQDKVDRTIARICSMPQYGQYRCVMIDYPWWWSGGGDRPRHYERMRDGEIYALADAIRGLAHPDGAWFLVWGTGAKMATAAELAKRHRLKFSGRQHVWIKLLAKYGEGGEPLLFHRASLHKGMGYISRKNAEDLWTFKLRRPKVQSRDVDEVILSSIREHSRKPTEAYARVEKFCAGPRADVFSRERREGWDGFGDEADKFTREAA